MKTSDTAPEHTPWYALRDPHECPSPSLLVYPERIRRNIETMLRMTGGPDRLRPHIKTHKMAEVIAMQLEAGIDKFKCATLSEAELLARCGAADVLLAMQLTGPGLDRYISLLQRYPETRFSTLFDCEKTLRLLSGRAAEAGLTAGLYMDLNTGMDRSGIQPGNEALELYIKANTMAHLDIRGLHAYDGHLRHEQFEERKKACDEAFEAVESLKQALEEKGLAVPDVIAGGSPTFPVHALREQVSCSPGTTLLWDERYATSFPDMPFEKAAVLFTRVISKPAENLLCLDLGHKSLAPEMPFPRVGFLNLKAEQVSQSEEHLVVRVGDTDSIEVGDHFYAVPMHVCPTVTKFPEVFPVMDGKINPPWRVAARDHLWQEAASGLAP